MAVFDTEENKRSDYTRRTLRGLRDSVDWSKHRLIVVDNASCEETKDLLKSYANAWPHMTVITNKKNLGTAEAINLAWRLRNPGEHCIKIDNDIIIKNCSDWVEQLEEVVELDAVIGQVGLKRVDCIETTTNPNAFYRSTLRQLRHEPGKRWVVVEAQFHVMGSCVLHSSALLERIGYLYQIGVYGFDDSFMSYRARIAGFDTVMLPHIVIAHIDTGDNPYQKIKEAQANDVWSAGLYQKTLKYYQETKDVKYDPYAGHEGAKKIVPKN
jgi:GT2 family glycosyltransferase